MPKKVFRLLAVFVIIGLTYAVLWFTYPKPCGKSLYVTVDNETPYALLVDRKYPSTVLQLKKYLFERLNGYSDEQLVVWNFFQGFQLCCKRQNPFGYSYFILMDQQSRPYYIFVDHENVIYDILYPKEGFPTAQEVEELLDQKYINEQIFSVMRWERNFMGLYSIQTLDGIYIASVWTDTPWCRAYFENDDIEGLKQYTRNVALCYVLPMDKWAWDSTY